MEKTAIVQKMNEAITAGDAEQFQAAFVELCDKIQESVIEQARGIVEEADQRILSERGVRQLTSKEKEYYQKLAEAMKSTNPKQAVENLDVVMPYTVIDKVFEDLKTDHPLLSKIQFTSVTGLTRMMMNTNGYQKAAWGKLCAEAVFGMAKLYFMGSGIENNGRILYSDDYRFLEDERVYLIKMYGHGFAVDDNAFMLLDISDLQPAYYEVEVVPSVENVENANLADFKVGGHTLTPEFEEGTLTYTLTTTDASNTVQAVIADSTAELELTYNDKPIANGSRVTWASGAGNVVKAKVTDGKTTKTYQVTVTKNEA